MRSSQRLSCVPAAALLLAWCSAPMTIAAQGHLLITEFMAINDSTLTDTDGDFSDWIEIHNPATNAINLAGYHLTDNPGRLDKWTFPAVTLPAGGYLIVFASGKDRTDPAGELHTNFRLDGDGEYLALVDPALEIVHAYSPAFPAQSPDVSYGIGSTTLIAAGAEARVFVPTDGALGTRWTGAPEQEPFDDSAWQTGPTGVGFQQGVASALAHQEPNLVSYWTFDSKQDATVPDQVPGSTHAGELVNGADITTGNQGFGGVGEALQPNADGNGSTPGHLRAGDPTSYDFNSSFTWHARIKTGSGSGDRGILARAPEGTDWNQGSKALFLRNNEVQFDAGWVGNPHTGFFANDNQWHQIVVTYEATTDLLRIYVDPSPSNPTPRYSQTFDVNRYDEHTHVHNGNRAETAFNIGWGSRNFVSGEFLGLIDDVAVWRGAFPPADVALLAQGEPILGGGPYGGALQTQVPAGTTSVYVRLPFTVTNATAIHELRLRLKYDDGFAAYLNGQLVAAANAPAAPVWNSTATADRDPAQALVFEEFDLSPFIGALVDGTNVLAIQVLSRSASSTEMLLLPELRATELAAGGSFLAAPTPGEINAEGLFPPAGEVRFSVASATFTGTQVVALGTDFPSGVIRYTTDGSVPDEASTLYAGPLTLTTSTHIRARVFAPGYSPGPVRSGTYLKLATNSNLAGIPAPASFNSDLPVVILDNFGGSDLNQSEFKPVQMLIFEPGPGGRSALAASPDISLRSVFRVRGASTAGLEKKQYRVEIRDEEDQDLDVSLLGLPPESDWVFGGPYIDEALIRNPLVFELGREMGLAAPRTRYCEVFLNTGGGEVQASDYVGVYQIIESIKQSPNRVDIAPLRPGDNTEPNISGGYIIRHEASVATGPLLRGWRYLEVHDPDDLTPAQLDWISAYVNRFDAILRQPTFADPQVGYPAYIDVDSFINTMIINEFAREQDSYVRSAYLYKDRGGPLVNGPLWDYNLSFGISCCFDSHATNDAVQFGGWQWNHTYNRGARENGVGDWTPNPTLNHFDWYTLLLRDPDYWQRFIDRYQELRRGILSTRAFNERVEAHAARIAEAQARNFIRFRTLGVRTTGFQRPEYVFPTWREHIEHVKRWAALRTAWMDSQFVPPPDLNHEGGAVPAGFELMISAPVGEIYYTLDGRDPRASGGGVAPGALRYTGPINITANAHVVARARLGNEWSGPREAVLVVSLPPLVITELMYHPLADGTNIEDRFEFVEVLNRGAGPLDLQGFQLEGGITFRFPSLVLSPGQRALVVNNRAAFESRYGSGRLIAGEYAGELDNDSDRITLRGPHDAVILDFRYRDRWYPITDGLGFSLVVVDEAAPLDRWADETQWRPSGVVGGSPGAMDPPPPTFPRVVVNEVLAHTIPPVVDALELHNLSDTPADVSGWFLTDDFGTPQKFRIPADTVIPPGGFATFGEADFNAGPGVPFALSALGDEAYVFSGDGTNLTGYVHGFAFGPTANGVSLGRHLTSTGEEHFVAQSTNTLGAPNAGPRVGPVVISEIMYHPPDVFVGSNRFANYRDEYIELHNISANPVALFDPVHTSNTWRVAKAVSYQFPPNTVVPPDGYLLLVGFDPVLDPQRLAAFRAPYGLGMDVPVLGPYQGRLQNAGEAIELQMPGAPVTAQGPDLGRVPYILVDRVAYDDQPPWPSAPDGTGYALTRIDDSAYGDDPINWAGTPPSPGRAAAIGTPPTIVAGPQSQTAIATHSVSFSVVATGTGPLRYQWRHDGRNLYGATNSQLVLENLTPDQAGTYSVVVLGPDRSITSDPAVLTVLVPPTIVTRPQDVSVWIQPDPRAAPTTNATFTVEATSPTPLAYQWYFNRQPIPGATGPSLTIVDVQTNDWGEYTVSVANEVTNVISEPAWLYPLVTPMFLEQPLSQTVPTNSSVTLSTRFFGWPPPFEVQWRLLSIIKATNVQNDFTSFFTFTAAAQETTERYRAIVINRAAGRSSAFAMITTVATVDTDQDGLPDDWETANDLNPNDGTDRDDDRDGDGFLNWEEYIAGTAANDASSLLRIEAIGLTNGVTLAFPAQAYQTYTVEYSDELTPVNWRKLTDIVARATNRVATVVDPLGTTNRFYRVVTPRQP